MMAEPVASLLERGLRHYALGEIERAVACWREALERDPASARAREYLTLVRASVPGGAMPLQPATRVSTPGPRRRTPGPPPPPPPDPEPEIPSPRAMAQDVTQVEATEELVMPPEPVWAPPLEGLWSESVPEGPGDSAGPPPKPLQAARAADGSVPVPLPGPPLPQAEIDVKIDVSPGPAARDAEPIEVSPGPGLSPPTHTPGPGDPSHVLVGTPVDAPFPWPLDAGDAPAAVAAPPPARAAPPPPPDESAAGPFGAAEAFDVGPGGRRPAASGWEVGPDATPAEEMAVEGSDALGLVNARERARPVAAPVRAPEASSPSSVADTLMRGARELFELGDFSGSLELVQKALDADPGHHEAKNYLDRNQGTLIQMYESKLGLLQARPRVMLKPDEIVWLSLDHRAGFVLAQIDGTVTYDDIFSVSSLPRLDTAKILAELLEQGVIAA